MMKRISSVLAILCAVFAIGSAAQADTNANLGFMDWDPAAAQEAVSNASASSSTRGRRGARFVRRSDVRSAACSRLIPIPMAM